MFIEVKNYKNGTTQARISDTRPARQNTEQDCTEYYLEEVNDFSKWLGKHLSLDANAPLTLDLKDGNWVDITNYAWIERV